MDKPQINLKSFWSRFRVHKFRHSLRVTTETIEAVYLLHITNKVGSAGGENMQVLYSTNYHNRLITPRSVSETTPDFGSAHQGVLDAWPWSHLGDSVSI